MRRIVITLLLVVCLTLAFAAPAFARSPADMPGQAAEGLSTAVDSVPDSTAADEIVTELSALAKQ